MFFKNKYYKFMTWAVDEMTCVDYAKKVMCNLSMNYNSNLTMMGFESFCDFIITKMIRVLFGLILLIVGI